MMHDRTAEEDVAPQQDARGQLSLRLVFKSCRPKETSPSMNDNGHSICFCSSFLYRTSKLISPSWSASALSIISNSSASGVHDHDRPTAGSALSSHEYKSIKKGYWGLYHAGVSLTHRLDVVYSAGPPWRAVSSADT